ncbi:4Fe-4S dicluster domain-containing protein [Chloroflexota bacterium]
MSKWNLIIDVATCHDCNNCFLSCKDEFCENDFLPYSVAQPRHGHRWMDILRKERGQYPLVDVAYLPVPCMHCDDAPCITEDGAVYRREDGIILINPEKAKGQKDLLDLCPYGSVWWNDEEGVAQKCTFCAHLLDDGWAEPRCVQACPTGAMRFLSVDDADMERRVDEERLEVYHPEYQTGPRVYYKNLFRYARCFIGGNVALKDVDECAEGAQVSLRDGSGQLAGSATTNNYGDFKIDNLKEDSGEYSLEVEYRGYQKHESKVDLKDSVNVGTIFLQNGQ